MEIVETKIADIKILVPEMQYDARGFFMETYQKKSFSSLFGEMEFVQDNHSRSGRHVLRGLHYQLKHAQGKLVRVVRGETYNVAVDIRKSSISFGCWVGVSLSAKNKRQLWIPAGFAHGFFTLSAWADLIYKTTDYYNVESERCIRWDDNDLQIRWPLEERHMPILSDKDRKGVSFRQAEVYA